MRADRLVAALLVLQARGRTTAAALAAELEVSERTARRDLEALALAGVPVYSQPGRHGGWALVGGARTDLTGLTASEVRALFLLTGPSAGNTEVRGALRKLVQALPATFRAEAEAAATAVVADMTAWDSGQPLVPEHLHELQQAVIDRERVRLHYNRRDGTEGMRVVEPYGLVTKRGVWYLVAGTEDGRRTFRADRVAQVTGIGERFVRPPDFDLAATWRQALAELDQVRLPFVARALVAPEHLGTLRTVVGTPVEVVGEDADGRAEVVIHSYSARMVAGQLAGFGAMAELRGPEEALAEMRRVSRELSAVYLSASGALPPPGR